MRFRLTLIQKYTLVSALCVLALVLGLGTLVARHLSDRMLERDGQLTAEFVRAQVREHLTPADFAVGAPGPFEEVFQQIRQIPELLQVNVFDRNGTILWSSEPSLIGQRFPGKHDLQEALAGRLVTEVATGAPEQLQGPGVPDTLVELYIPLYFTEGGAVVGVLETYKAPVLLDQIRQAIRVTWGLIVVGGGLLYVSLFWLVRRVWVSLIASEKNLTERHRDLALVNARLETLAHLDRVVLSSLEPGKVFDLVVESAVKLLPGVSLAHLWLLDEKTETLWLAAEAGRAGARPAEMRLHLRNSRIGWIVASGQPHASPRVLEDPLWRNVEWARREGIVSHAGVPIRSETRLLGGLSVLTREARAFTGAELGLLASLATSAAVAIENARLFAEVRRARTEWQETFDAIDAPVILVSPRHEVMRVNRAGAAAVGTRPEELIGRSCCDLFCGRAEPGPDCPVAEVFRSSRPASLEVTGISGDGRAEQVWAYPVFGEQGGIEAVVEHRRDITEVKEAEERLVQVEKLRALGELAGGVAHDFNNVLAVVLGRADLLAASLERGHLDADRIRRSLEIVKQAAADGAAIVRRIQGFARFQRAPDLTPLDLNAVIRDAVEFTRPRWADEVQARGLEIAVDLHLAEVPPVEGNAVELREVLTNMILNAVDAMPRGGRISLRSWLEGSHVYAAVTDTGIGMSEKVRQRIFEPFFTTKGRRGTGLGLSVAYGIIQRHGGEIRVESAPDRGSTFTVCLPVTGKPAAAPPEPAPEVACAARILVIEDEEDVLEMLREMLASAGHSVSTARSGEAGIAAFQQGEFDLVLSDLGMPGMSGWEVARKIHELRPKGPVVLVTGWGEQVDPELLRQSGIVRTVAKPVEMKDLLRVVSEVLRGETGR